MTLTRYVFFAMLFIATSAMADGEKFTMLKAGSEVYSNVVVTSVTATDIYFTHSRGLGNAKLKNLEPEVQKQFKFDSAKAAQTEQVQKEANAAYTRAAIEAKPAPRAPELVDPPHFEVTAINGVALRDIAPHTIHAKSFLDQPAPTLQVEKWLKGPPETEGKFVLVDFWATWCEPCRKSIPGLNELSRKFADKLVVIGISDEPELQVQKMTDPKIEYYVAIDTQRHMKKEVEVKGIPHAMLIDPKGVVRFEGMPHYLTQGGLAKLIATYSH
jgi:thiol-disulfide isomerase/thioredoxin